MQEYTFQYPHPFELESGATLPHLTLAYYTAGRLNADKSNVIWVFHALTANAQVSEWWPGLLGENKIFDPTAHFIICVNMPGSCYGSTGPASINPLNGKPYAAEFPLLSIRDMVKAYQLLKTTLGISRIQVAIGASMGGMQTLEWAIDEPELFEKLILIATNARHSPWGIAFNATQRMAIETGDKGLEVARAIAMLSYRSYELYKTAQSDPDDILSGFKAEHYQRYQGEKLKKRFDSHSYVCLSKAMDTHNTGRGRGSPEEALARITAGTLIIAIESDILFPMQEQLFLYSCISQAQFRIIDSPYGHDAFLVEYSQLEEHIQQFIHPFKHLPAPKTRLYKKRARL